ncbi:MAG: hypothetical protein IPH62_20020 [Ignavibacteriae bacterium]|nr:hypothetical protein [Ignavibacteriota bacterium]
MIQPEFQISFLHSQNIGKWKTYNLGGDRDWDNSGENGLKILKKLEKIN